MAAAVIIHRKRTERGHQTLDDDAGELDDDVGERVPEPGPGCQHEGVLERKIVSTRSQEVQWQQRLLVLGKDRLFFCKTTDRQHVYDHIPLSEIVDVEAFSELQESSAPTVGATPSEETKPLNGATRSETDSACKDTPELLADQSGHARTTSAARVQVSVLQARGLTAKDWGGSSDPYVVLRLASAPETSKTQTGVVSKNVNPVWNEALDLTSAHIDVESVLVSVFDKDVIADDFIGSVNVPLCDLINDRSTAVTPSSSKHIVREPGTRLGASEPCWYQLLDEAHKPAGEVQLGFEVSVAEPQASDLQAFCFRIQTDPQGFNVGRTYTHRCGGETAAAEWVEALRKGVKDAMSRKLARDLLREHGHSRFAMLRARAERLEQSAEYQYALALVIMVAFLVDIAEAQVTDNTANLSHFEVGFETFNTVITLVFAMELLFVLLANSHDNFRPFWSDAGHLIDFCVVAVCMVQVVMQYIDSDMPSLKMLRMLRVFRVTRIFYRFESLHRLIIGIQYAAVPVLNALFILLIFTSVYASIGTRVFRDKSPEYFADFTTSLFTLIQCLSGDSWASGISRSIFRHEETEWSVGIFFVSYYALATVVLLNVVVAVLLDEFITSIAEEKEQLARDARRLRDQRRCRGVLDPVTSSLCDFQDVGDLCAKIDQLYERLDVDSNGGLDFDELQQGVRRLPGGAKVHITRDDFDVITQHGQMLGPGGEFDKFQFQDMMLGELLRYAHREVMNVLQDSEKEEFRALVLLIKMMEIRLGKQEKQDEPLRHGMARIMMMQEKLLAHLGLELPPPTTPPAAIFDRPKRTERPPLALAPVTIKTRPEAKAFSSLTRDAVRAHIPVQQHSPHTPALGWLKAAVAAHAHAQVSAPNSNAHADHQENGNESWRAGVVKSQGWGVDSKAPNGGVNASLTPTATLSHMRGTKPAIEPAVSPAVFGVSSGAATLRELELHVDMELDSQSGQERVMDARSGYGGVDL